MRQPSPTDVYSLDAKLNILNANTPAWECLGVKLKSLKLKDFVTFYLYYFNFDFLSLISDQPSYEAGCKGCFHRFYEWFCGFSTTDEREPTERERLEQERQMMDKIEQTKMEKIILNTGLIVVLTIGVFLYGWYA